MTSATWLITIASFYDTLLSLNYTSISRVVFEVFCWTRHPILIFLLLFVLSTSSPLQNIVGTSLPQFFLITLPMMIPFVYCASLHSKCLSYSAKKFFHQICMLLKCLSDIRLLQKFAAADTCILRVF